MWKRQRAGGLHPVVSCLMGLTAVQVIPSCNGKGPTEKFDGTESSTGDTNDGETGLTADEETETGGQDPPPDTGEDTKEPDISDLTEGLADDHWRYYFTNHTDGVKDDAEIFIGIVGKNWGEESYCKVVIDTESHTGTCENLVSSDSSPEPIEGLFYSLDQLTYVDLPAIQSARIFISVDDELEIFSVQADSYVGFVAPNLSNPDDPNIEYVFDFFEFTTGSASGGYDEKNSPFWGNTTQVDAFSLPIVATLYSRDGSSTEVGIDTGEYDRERLFDEFGSDAPPDFSEAFTDLIDESIRIDNASKSGLLSVEDSLAGTYFDAAIDELFSTTTPFNVSIQDWGECTGQVEKRVLTFECKDSGQTGRIAEPTTEEVLLCSGELGKAGTYTGELDGVMQAQVCAAFHRGVVMQPENWADEDSFYQTEPYNYYAGYWHERSIENKAYGFAYDDVHDKATLMYSDTARVLALDVHW